MKAKVKAYGAKFGEEYVPMFTGQPLQDVVFPLRFPSTPLFGSTDVGDVSYVAPTAWLNAACYAIGTSGHSWQLAAQGGHQRWGKRNAGRCKGDGSCGRNSAERSRLAGKSARGAPKNDRRRLCVCGAR